MKPASETLWCRDVPLARSIATSWLSVVCETCQRHVPTLGHDNLLGRILSKQHWDAIVCVGCIVYNRIDNMVAAGAAHGYLIPEVEVGAVVGAAQSAAVGRVDIGPFAVAHPEPGRILP